MAVDLTNLDLDLTLLQEIADGSDEFIVESIDMFLQQTPISIQEIGNAFDEMDWLSASAAAHKLKATLGFFGMLNSQALIQQIEQSCKTGNPEVMDVLGKYDQVQAFIAAGSVALQQIKEETEAGL